MFKKKKIKTKSNTNEQLSQEIQTKNERVDEVIKMDDTYVVTWYKRHGEYSGDTTECTKAFVGRAEAMKFKELLENANKVIGNTSEKSGIKVTKQEPVPTIKSLNDNIKEKLKQENDEKAEKILAEEWIWVEGYKGTDKDICCKKYQFKIGGIHRHDDSIKECESGFHFCLNMNDVFKYYPFNLSNRYFKVKTLVKKSDYELYGKIVNQGFGNMQIKDKLVAKEIEFISEITEEEYYDYCKKSKNTYQTWNGQNHQVTMEYAQIKSIEDYRECMKSINYDSFRKNKIKRMLSDTGIYSETFSNWFVCIKNADDKLFEKAIALSAENMSHDMRMVLLLS